MPEAQCLDPIGILHKTKQVKVIAVRQDDEWLVITVMAKYF